jgi:prevent-host-death family protein
VKTVNIHEAKTHLSKLVDEASKGQSFMIAKAGKPMVKVMALGAPACSEVPAPIGARIS